MSTSTPTPKKAKKKAAAKATRPAGKAKPKEKAKAQAEAKVQVKAKAQVKVQPRIRRARVDMREQLLDAALIEFAAHGFIGASTRAIAERVGAHQPQINYHFASKAALWRAAIDHLFNQLAAEIATPELPEKLKDRSPETLAELIAGIIERFIRFAACHPELHRIMMHESTTPSDRLEWMTHTHVQPVFATFKPAWQHLRQAGIAAPIDPELIHHVLVGAVSLIFVNAHEFTLLTGFDPTEPEWVERHVRGLVATLLPGFKAKSTRTGSGKS